MIFITDKNHLTYKKNYPSQKRISAGHVLSNQKIQSALSYVVFRLLFFIIN